MNSSIRVLFVHGLESNAKGTKYRLMSEQGFDVVAYEMHMSILKWRKKNAVVRQALRLPETRVSLLLLLVSFSLAALNPLFFICAALVVTFYGLCLKFVFARAMGRSFDACVAIQKRALHENDIDIVVGSSWGGAVTAELVAQDIWQGPTILLAPALSRVGKWSRRPKMVVELKNKTLSSPIVIFHDASDEVVDINDSRALAAHGDIELREVTAGGHRLLELLKRGELAATIKALVE